MKNDPGVKKLNCLHCAAIIVSVILIFAMSVIVPEEFIQDKVLSCFEFFGQSDFRAVFVENLGREKGFIATVIWTMTTILFGFLIMYYQMMGTRNFGLTNRKIISYTCGTYFIPIMVAINTVVVCFMTIAFYFDADTDFYLLAVYSFVLQGVMIFYCVYPTSYRTTQETIVKQEREHFYRFYRSLDCVSADQGKTPTIFMESILCGDELIEEKMEMVSQILRHPFELVYFDRERIAAAAFEYYYLNFTVLAVYLSKHREDTDYFYKMLYQEIGQWSKCFTYQRDFNKMWKSMERGQGKRKKIYFFNHRLDKYPASYQSYRLKKRREFEKCLKEFSVESADNYMDEIYFTKIFSCLAAFFQTFLSQKNVKNRWMAITYIINHLVHDEIKPWIQAELFLCIQFLVLTDQLDLSEERISNEFEDGLLRLEGCQMIEKRIREILDNTKKLKTIIIRSYPELLLPWIANVADSLENRFEILYRLKDSFKNRKVNILVYYLRRSEQTNDKAF